MPQLLRISEKNNMEFLSHRHETVCFTGHRPDGFRDTSFFSEWVMTNTIKMLLTLLTADAYKRGARYFITGMAAGVDIWAGEILLHMKRELPDIHLIAAVPYPGHEYSIRSKDKPLLYAIGDAADAVVCVSDAYSDWCFLRRNDYMLKASSAVLGIIRREKGGTVYTLKNAGKYGVSRRIINLSDYRLLIPLLERYPECCRMMSVAQRYDFWKEHQRLLYQCGLFSED